ncbi:hypothetical protein [Allokutzneria albata]|uniref:hypothetical protein n=1 Tax=Allokutzneria albata TaxID=211114 RepID=UPI0012DDE115|nr:hypothetical protein [Allokutzneria albata]
MASEQAVAEVSAGERAGGPTVYGNRPDVVIVHFAGAVVVTLACPQWIDAPMNPR